MKEDTMANFPKGWIFQEEVDPLKISDFITFAQVNDGVNVYDGLISKSDNYFLPTGGTWQNSPNFINAEPKIVAINSASFKNCVRWSQAMNNQIKFSNLNAPQSFNNFLFAIGNIPGVLDYDYSIEMNFGPTTFSSIQLSLALNALGKGDKHGQVEVFDFGIGPFTSVNTFSLSFGSFYGKIDLGWRFESSGNQSFLMLTSIIIFPPISFDYDEDDFMEIGINEPHFCEPIPLEQMKKKDEKKKKQDSTGSKEPIFGGKLSGDDTGYASENSNAFTIADSSRVTILPPIETKKRK